MGAQQSTTGKTSRLKGTVLIINNKTFDNLARRHGSEYDVERLKNVLSKLGLVVQVVADGTKQEILLEVEKYATNWNVDENSCVLMVVMTHGKEGDILFARDTTYYTSDIWKPFMNEKFDEILKLFVFQACRGNQTEEKIGEKNLSLRDETSPWRNSSFPKRKNYLLAYSTIEDHVSFRNSIMGSWYIQTLCDNLEKIKELTNIYHFFNDVHKSVVSNTARSIHGEELAQTPVIMSSAQCKFLVPVITGDELSIENINLDDQIVSDGAKKNEQTYEQSSFYYDISAEYYENLMNGTVIVFYTDELKEAAQDLHTVYQARGYNSEKFAIDCEDVVQYLSQLSKSSSLENASCLQLIFLTNSFSEHKLELDGTASDEIHSINLGRTHVPVSSLWTMFLASNCKSLRNKPKIFMFFDSYSQMLDAASFERKASYQNDPVNNHADFLVLFGYGKEYIESFIRECFDKNEDDLINLIVRSMSSFYKRRDTYEIPYFQSTLRFPVYFKVLDKLPEDLHDKFYCKTKKPCKPLDSPNPGASYLQVRPATGVKYDRNQQKKCALIINNINFTRFSKREGHEDYVKFLRCALENVGFEVSYLEDGTKDEIIQQVKTFAQKQNTIESCCILVFVMTHGESEGVLCADDRNVPLGNSESQYLYYTSDIWEHFKSETLQNKFKIFIFQACRNIEGNVGEPRVIQTKRSTINQNEKSRKYALKKLPRPPHMPNTLLVHSCMETYGSWRTFLLESLTREWWQLKQEENLLTFLTRVIKNVMQNTRFSQTPIITSFLHKNFNVPTLPEQFHSNDFNKNLMKNPSTIIFEEPSFPQNDNMLLYLIYNDRDEEIMAKKISDSLKRIRCCKVKPEKLSANYFEMLSKSEELKNVSCFIMITIAHLQQDIFERNEHVFVNDFKVHFDLQKSYFLHEIWRNFTATQCEYLRNVPKIFFFLDNNYGELECPNEQGKLNFVNDHADMLIFYGLGSASCNKLADALLNQINENIFEILLQAMDTKTKSSEISYFESTLRIPLLFRKGESFDDVMADLGVVEGDFDKALLKTANSSQTQHSFIEELHSKCENINIVDANGNTPLILATKSNNKTVIEVLLRDERCDVNIQGMDGMTALHWACSQPDDAGLEAAQLLFQHASQRPMRNIYNELPQDIAKQYDNEKIVKLLKAETHDLSEVKKEEKLTNWMNQNGCDQDDSVNTVYLRASEKGHLDIMKICLEEKNADVNYQHEMMNTALHFAVEHNYKNNAKYLLKKGANRLATNNDGKSAIQVVTIENFNEKKEVFKIIRDHKDQNPEINDEVFRQANTITDQLVQ